MITARRNQESIVRIWSEQLINAIEEEPEWKKDFHIGTLHQNALITLSRILQIAHANGIRPLSITHRIQWIQNLNGWAFFFSFEKEEDQNICWKIQIMSAK